MSRFVAVVGLAAVALACLTTAPVQAVDLLVENFNGLPLMNSVEEGTPGTNVWTNVPPAGWSVDNSGVPGNTDPPATDGIREWSGWSFADKSWWSTTAGDQRRSEFVNASGTVMIADPDEWDDAPHPGGPPDGPWYNTYISTPSISLAGIAAGSVTLDFDSSWRPEYDDNYHQTANIVVSYDGGAPVEILRWESDGASANFHPDAPNEHVTVGLNNPAGANSMVLTFGLFDAGNDWWWAVDNVHVQGVPEPSSLSLGLLAGLLGLGLRRRC
jgi:hypothetical protein